MATTNRFRHVHEIEVTQAAAGGGDILALANPIGENVIVTRVIMHVITASTGATGLDVGIAEDDSTSSDNLIDGIAVGAEGLFDNYDDQGDNGNSKMLWASDKFLTISKSSGGANSEIGLKADIYVEYLTKNPTASVVVGRAG